MSSEPGKEFAYNTGATTLLSGILQQATGKTAEEFAAETLFRDLGIELWEWTQTPSGHSNTGAGLRLRPLDMLKFGQLYVHDGFQVASEDIPGKQVVPSGWVARSGQPQLEEGVFPEDPGGPYNYGYQWWRFADHSDVVSNLAENDVYLSWGYGGQFIFVVPHLQAAIVSTARNGATSDRLFPALSDYIFPALQELAVPEPSTMLLSLLEISALGITRRSSRV